MDKFLRCQKVIDNVHRDVKKVKRSGELAAMMQAHQVLNDYRNNNTNFIDLPVSSRTLTLQIQPDRQREFYTGDSDFAPVRPVHDTIMKAFQRSRKSRNTDGLKRLQRSEAFADNPGSVQTLDESKVKRSVVQVTTKMSTRKSSKTALKKRNSRKSSWNIDGRQIKRVTARKSSTVPPEDPVPTLKVLELPPLKELLIAFQKEKEIRARQKAAASLRRKSKSKSQSIWPATTDDKVLVGVMRRIEELDIDRTKPKPPWNASCKVHTPKPPFGKGDEILSGIGIGPKTTCLLPRTPPVWIPDIPLAKTRISTLDGGANKSAGLTPPVDIPREMIRSCNRHGRPKKYDGMTPPLPETCRSRKKRIPDYEERLELLSDIPRAITSIPTDDKRFKKSRRTGHPPLYNSRVNTNIPTYNGRLNKLGEIKPPIRRRIPPILDSCNECPTIPKLSLSKESVEIKLRHTPQFYDQNNFDEIGIPSPRQSIFSPRHNHLPCDKRPENLFLVVQNKSEESFLRDSVPVSDQSLRDINDRIKILEEMIGLDTSAITNSIVKKVRDALITNNEQSVPPKKRFFSRLFSKKAGPNETDRPVLLTNLNDKNGFFGRIWKSLTPSRHCRVGTTTQNV